ncbi:hypothetical protein [Elizabethkingia anophelis]|uniref:hypothetical protein n=1 Tax=Elizabethkingia anophelis TaxID=1117645 RepID=UPI0039886D5E
MNIKRLSTKTKMKLVLLKFALFKFLGKFIPYFKNKFMGFINKKDISENVRSSLNSILHNNNVRVDLEKNNNFTIGGNKDKIENKGLDYVDNFSISYKIKEWGFNIQLNYNNKTIIYSTSDTDILNADRLVTLNNVLNAPKNKQIMIEYFKNLRTIL